MCECSRCLNRICNCNLLHTHTYKCVCVCVYIYIYMCVCVYVYIYIYIYIHTHIYITRQGVSRIYEVQILGWGPGVAWWLRRCATSRTASGSIPGGVTGFFSDIFPSDSAPSENEYPKHSWG
jgi:hypothetical protein